MRIWSVLLVACLTLACNDESLLEPQEPPTLVVVQANTSNLFNPRDVTILAGGQVRWNFQSTPHTVIFQKVANVPPDIIEESSNKTENRTFAVPGTYLYECGIHEGMEGSVIVVAPSGE